LLRLNIEYTKYLNHLYKKRTLVLPQQQGITSFYILSKEHSVIFNSFIILYPI